MCKHVPFDRNSWAPCGICLKARRVAATIKNEAKLRAEIAEWKEASDEAETRGYKATANSRRAEAELIESWLIEAGLPV